MKILSKQKRAKFEEVLKRTSIDSEIKSKKLTKEERVEIKSYAIKKNVKKKLYVRN